MRFALVGTILLLISGVALGQVEGTVRSVGYEGAYRANTWTPMRIVLSPTTGNAEELRIEVVQEDLDRDPVRFFSAPFVLTGNPAGGQRLEQMRWMYFIPQPSGLDTGGDSTELTRKLRVFVCTAGKKRLMQLPMPGVNLQPLDGGASGVGFGVDPARKLVLVVVDKEGSDHPPVGLYEGAVGVNEAPIFVTVGQDELPDNVIGYHSVDSVLWLNADPQHKVSSTAMAALRDWVREGGRLVVCQNENRWQENMAGDFGEMLPVKFADDYRGVETVDNKVGLWALRRMGYTVVPPELWSPPKTRQVALQDEARRADAPFWLPQEFSLTWPKHAAPVGDPWQHVAWSIDKETGERLSRKFPLAQAIVKPGASVEMYADEYNRTPYLVRWAYGAGAVAWVAQDLGKDAFHDTQNDYGWYGWPRIWDRVFDWRNDTISGRARNDLPLIGLPEQMKHLEPPQYGVDVSRAMGSKMELPTRGAALVGVAMLFFIAYWVVAGPVSYFALLKKKLATLSWPVFAVCAVAGTALTVLVVRVVLRGAPEAQHLTIVRIAPGEDTVIQSHFGLYIPRDGLQTIELKGTDPARESHITAYPLHRKFTSAGTDGFLSNIEYEVPIPAMGRDPAKDPEPAVSVPYRSTLKKFGAKWVGKTSMTIDGAARLTSPMVPEGTLVNQLGVDLHDVYIIFRQGPLPDQPDRVPPDCVVYMPDYRDDNGLQPAWAKGEPMDLLKICSLKNCTAVGAEAKRDPETRGRRWGLIDLNGQSWPAQWCDPLHGIAATADFGDMDKAEVLMALYDRLPPPRRNDLTQSDERAMVLRAAGRSLDASSAVSAGSMLVLGKATGPLPFPLEVQGDKTGGDGVTYYQVVVPLDRSALAAKPITATRPASKPATQAASQPLERE